MISIYDLHWVAGLLEGDGFFTQRSSLPTIGLQMVDEDIVRRVASLLGGSVCRRSQRPKRKQQFCATIQGPKASGWMATLQPLMGNRRYEKIAELFSLYNCRQRRRYHRESLSDLLNRTVKLAPIHECGDWLCDVHWLAGLLEAEGYFGCDSHGTLLINLGMIDEDVVNRAARLFGSTVHVHQQKKRQPRRSVFWCRPTGIIAAGWMMTLYALMGSRRRVQIKTVLAEWRRHKTHGRYRQACYAGHPLQAPSAKTRKRRCLICARNRKRVADGRFGRRHSTVDTKQFGLAI